MSGKKRKKRKNAEPKNTDGSSSSSSSTKKQKTIHQNEDEFGNYLSKDIYGAHVSIETESDRFKVAERVGKMRAKHSNSICASDYEMKKKWSAGWSSGFIGTIGIRRSSGPPAPRRNLATSATTTVAITTTTTTTIIQ